MPQNFLFGGDIRFCYRYEFNLDSALSKFGNDVINMARLIARMASGSSRDQLGLGMDLTGRTLKWPSHREKLNIYIGLNRKERSPSLAKLGG
jgi:hypothetical protein